MKKNRLVAENNARYASADEINKLKGGIEKIRRSNVPEHITIQFDGQKFLVSGGEKHHRIIDLTAHVESWAISQLKK
jgi:hypothetical protein